MPKIIHQMWLPNWSQSPLDVRRTRQEWCGYNPEWTYMFWDRLKVTSLIRDKYPEFTEVWEDLESERIIKMADFARLLVLYHFGGLYVDMDLSPLKPMELSEEPDIEFLLCSEYTEEGQPVRVCNGFLGSCQRKYDPLYEMLINCHSRRYLSVLKFLGPVVITSSLATKRAKILPWQLVISKEITQGALAVNLNSMSWGDPSKGAEWYKV